MAEIVAGVDLGGTNIKIALVNQEPRIIAKSSLPTPPSRTPEDVIRAMVEGVVALLKKHELTQNDLVAAGCGAPGPMNWKTGVVYSPPNLVGWKNVPLADEMQRRLGVPCFVENDANAACYGEFWLGAGRGTENMAVLTLGTGVGGGVIVFGKLLRGIDGTAAELGHLKVQRNGRLCGCGARGCLEQYASVTGMVQTAREGLESGETSTLHEKCRGDYTQLTGKMIYDAAREGDAFARWVFEETAYWLGYGISSIINYQNPEKVVLCGGMIAAGDLLFEPVRRVAHENAFEVPAKRCAIVPAGLGADSGVIGAAGCAWSRLKHGE
jgi:glucokinase